MENSLLKSVLIVVTSIVAILTLIASLRKYFQGGQFRKKTRIDGKIVVITGANSGIGKATAIDLAKRGGKVYMACRDQQRGQVALEEVKSQSGSDNVQLIQLDLASFESIREFSKKFHELEQKLHILINNAGVLGVPRDVTKEGFEMQIGVNHLGHFLLTNLLLDLMKKAAPARIINVSSVLHNIGRIKKEDLNSEKSYSKWEAYGQSKLANILFSRELARRLSKEEIVVNSLHPGAVDTNITRNLILPIKIIFWPIRRIFWKTSKSGAQTQIRLAVDPELEKVSGKYWIDCKEAKTSAAGEDDETAAWLWRSSGVLTDVAA